MGLECVANATVRPEHREETRVRADAPNGLRQGRPVLDRELLSRSDRLRRERRICSETRVCGSSTGAPFDLVGYAQEVSSRLIPPTSTHSRIFQNVARLFSSRRITTDEIVRLVNLTKSQDTISAFREEAKALFSHYDLFFYDYFPYEGAVICFREPTK